MIGCKKQPDKEALLKEYELCQNSAQSLETPIWQTSAAIGIGSIGSLILVATAERPLPLIPTIIIGAFVCLGSYMWLFIAKRWWSIQHTNYLRMRHIEEDLKVICQTRYIEYRDILSAPEWKLRPKLLFSVKWKSQEDLEQDTLLSIFQQKFEIEQVLLSDNISIETQEKNKRWQIDDRDQAQIYIIIRERRALKIYKTVEQPDDVKQRLNKNAGLSVDRLGDLKLLGDYQHTGVKEVLEWFPWLNSGAWLAYVLYLLRCKFIRLDQYPSETSLVLLLLVTWLILLVGWYLWPKLKQKRARLATEQPTSHGKKRGHGEQNPEV